MRSLKGLGTALLWAGRPSQARTVLQTYLQEKPGDQDARRLLGRVATDDLLIHLAADLSDVARPITAELLFSHHDTPVPAVVKES